MSDLWQWISQNSSALSAVVSFLTLLMWLFYAQLLLSSFRRQRRARVLINQSHGRGLDSVCMVSNMSHEPIYVQCLLIGMDTRDGRISCSVTDMAREHDEGARAERLGEVTRQGPLESGRFMNIGSFNGLIRQAAAEHGWDTASPDIARSIGLGQVTITAIANYGPDGQPLGFHRTFVIESTDEGASAIRPESIYTQRLTGRRSKRQLESRLREIT